jgi:hypothetical protein
VVALVKGCLGRGCAIVIIIALIVLAGIERASALV